MLVQVLAGPHAVDSGVAMPLDMLRAANMVADHLGRRDNLQLPRFHTEVAGLTSSVRLASGITIENCLTPRTDAAAVIVPGRWVDSEADLDQWRRTPEYAALVHHLKKVVAVGTPLYGACTAVNPIAETGVLDGLEATTTWWLAGSFTRAYPRVRLDTSKAIVTHPKVASAGAVMAQSSLVLHLIRRHMGPTVARGVTRYLMLDEYPGQTPYMALGQLRVDDPVVAAVDDYVRRNMATIEGVDELAAAARVSPRTLDRRIRAAYGLSTGRWLRRLRVEAAVHLLETGREPVVSIAKQVGLNNPVTLRRELRLLHGTTPGQVRSRVRAGAAADSNDPQGLHELIEAADDPQEPPLTTGTRGH